MPSSNGASGESSVALGVVVDVAGADGGTDTSDGG